MEMYGGIEKILHEWSVHMEFMKRAFCLSYGPFKWDFIVFNIISTRKRIADMDVANDVTRSRQSVITCGHTIFIH